LDPASLGLIRPSSLTGLGWQLKSPNNVEGTEFAYRGFGI
jgi:hypothetical protein